MIYLQPITEKLKNIWNSKKTLAFILGVISVEVLPPHDKLWIGFFSFSALILLISSISKAKKSFAIGYWFGFGYFACNMAWISNALLIDAPRFGWLFPITLAAAGAFFGLFTAFPALLSSRFKNFYALYFSFSAFWVIFEWIRSFIFTGFPWNLLGSSLIFSDVLIQTGALIGTYGLSLLVIMSLTAPALFIKYQDKKSLFISISLILTIGITLIIYGNYHLQKSDNTPSELSIRIVQPAIPQEMKWQKNKLENNFAEYIKLSQANGLDKIKFVIWGETATPFPLDFEPQYLQQIKKAVPPKGYLITGMVRYRFHEGNFRPQNSMAVINYEGKIITFYDKTHLVPFGEYIPLRNYLPKWIRPITNTIADFLPGSGPSVIKLDNTPGFGTLICYEVIFPHQIINPQNRPQWLINLTNDGWYGQSQGPYQHLATTRLRAVEEGLTLVRAANTGISAVISPYGQIISSLDLNKKGFIDINLPQQLHISTTYGKFGNIIPLALCLINIIISFVIRFITK